MDVDLSFKNLNYQTKVSGLVFRLGWKQMYLMNDFCIAHTCILEKRFGYFLTIKLVV